MEEEVLERTAQEGARGHHLCCQEDVAQPVGPLHSEVIAAFLQWEQAASSDRAPVNTGSPLRLCGGTVICVPRQQWAAPLMGTTTSSNSPLHLVLKMTPSF